MSANAFLNVDEELQTCEQTTIDSILEEIDDRKEQEIETMEEEETEPQVSSNEARRHLSQLRRFAEQEGADDIFDTLNTLDKWLTDTSMSKKKQSSITDFFSKP